MDDLPTISTYNLQKGIVLGAMTTSPSFCICQQKKTNFRLDDVVITCGGNGFPQKMSIGLSRGKTLKIGYYISFSNGKPICRWKYGSCRYLCFSSHINSHQIFIYNTSILFTSFIHRTTTQTSQRCHSGSIESRRCDFM